jgi:fucose 4-O-acetylase-like acetyltransferase
VNTMTSVHRVRDIYIDALKGLTILLVILAHALQRSLPDAPSNMYFNSIQAFHMPLFMFLSGYILYVNKPTYNINWMTRKFQRLIIPFFAWIIIFYYASNFSFTGLEPYVDYSGSLTDSIIRDVMQPGNGLWFLWVLFIFYVMVAGAAKSGKPYLFGCCVLVTLAALTAVNFNLFGMSYVRLHLIFFVSGYIFSMYRTNINSYLNLKSNVIGKKFYFGLPLISSSYTHRVAEFAVTLASHILLAFVGIAFTWVSMKVILVRIPKIQRQLAWIGGITLEIYASHLLFLNTGFGTGYIKVISTSIIALVASLILIYQIKKFNFLNVVLFGAKRRKKVSSSEEKKS